MKLGPEHINKIVTHDGICDEPWGDLIIIGISPNRSGDLHANIIRRFSYEIDDKFVLDTWELEGKFPFRFSKGPVMWLPHSKIIIYKGNTYECHKTGGWTEWLRCS